jgi:hypothetical protein
MSDTTAAPKEERKTMLAIRIGRRIRQEILGTHQRAIAQAMDKKDFLLDIAREYKVAVEVRQGKPVVRRAAVETLQKLIDLLTEQQKLYAEVKDGVLTLNEWEATIKTGTGSDLLAAVEMVALHQDETERRKAELRKLLADYQAVPGSDNVIVKIDELNLRLARAFVLTLDYARRFGQRADALMQLALGFVTHITVKAWVVEHPDTRHQFLKASLKVFDQGINATGRAGDAIGTVPDPHTQAASAGVKWSMVAAKAGKAVIDKLAISADVDRQINKVLKDQGLGNMLAKHDDDKLLIAKLLADKANRELALILELARPIVTVAIEWVPYSQVVSKVVDTVEKIIKSAVARYQAERLKLAGELTMKDVGTFKNFHKDLLDNMKDTIEHDILAVTDLVNFLTDALLATLIDDLMTMIMGVLPIDPAQAIDGAALRSKMNTIIASSQARTGVQIENPDAAIRPRPKVDSQGKAVTCLSGPIDEKNDGGYRYVRRDGTIGRLYLADLRFVPAEDDDVEAAQYRSVPDKDSHGRPLSEVNLAFKIPLQTVPGRMGYRARSHDVVGEIDEDFERFRSTGPDQERLDEGVWRTRSIDKAGGGYWNLVDGKRSGDMVKGTWHRPWQARSATFAFRSESGARQFALGIWKTGDPTVTIGDAVGDIAETGYPVPL